MTKFEDLELIYNQFLNLSTEIKTLVQEENFTTALEKTNAKEKLIKKLISARKTITITEENKEKLESLEKKLRETDKENLDFSAKIHANLKEKLKSAKKQTKVQSAYEVHTEESGGHYVDITE